MDALHSFRCMPLHAQCHLCDKDPQPQPRLRGSRSGSWGYLGCLAGPASCASCHCMCTDLLNATVKAWLHKLLATTMHPDPLVERRAHVCRPVASGCAAPARLAVCKNARVVAIHHRLDQRCNLRKHIRLQTHSMTLTSAFGVTCRG